MPNRPTTLKRWQVATVFTLFAFFCMVFAWRQQTYGVRLLREHNDRVVAVCESENDTRQGIRDFLHEAFKTPANATPAQRLAIKNFLDTSDLRFAAKHCHPPRSK